ncbi:MAG TPA: CHAT domain-containing protein [Burkholderiaceae bacterium]|nr:CHAT domain-containing protein [Burkholderiaceae bacterium]
MADRLRVPGIDVTSEHPTPPPHDSREREDLRSAGFELVLEQLVDVGRSRAGKDEEIEILFGQAGPSSVAKSERGNERGEADTGALGGVDPEHGGGPDGASGVVCEVEFATGSRMYMLPETLYELFGSRPDRSAAVDPSEEWRIDPVVPSDGATRGAISDRIAKIGKWVVKWPLTLARGAAKGAVLGQPVQRMADAIEDRLHEGHSTGMYSLALRSDSSTPRFPAMEACRELPEKSGPLLLFLHGTLSSTKGSFGKLWGPGNREGAGFLEQLRPRYGDCVYGFEHHTLAESPVDNAIALLEAIPEKSELHLVSHSRGGLIGELLCLSGLVDRAEFSPERLRGLLSDASRNSTERIPANIRTAWEKEPEKLCEFLKKLHERELKVTRFVRVACPSEGTTLAMRKLDLWLSLYRHLLDKAVDTAIEQVAPPAIPVRMLIALIARVRGGADKESDDSLPGIWSMMPGNPLISLLNLQALSVDADLTVIAGDNKRPRGIGGAFEYALNKFFRDQNDYVVNTGAMFGGLPRMTGARFQIAEGEQVDHFSYFRNDNTVRWLAAGLSRSDQDTAGFLPIGASPRKAPQLRAVLKHPSEGPRPVVYVLPGIMGSELAVRRENREEQVWLHLARLAMGGLAQLAIPNPFDTAGERREIVATRLVEDYYADFIDFLAETHVVRPFAYDWRLGILESGKRLGASVAATLDEIEAQRPRPPVRIVGHSMGGLVARAMVAACPDVWKRLTAHEGARVLMLGTPNGGSFEIVRLLMAQSGTLRKLSLLDLTSGPERLIGTISRFPGVLQLLPNAIDDFFSQEVWSRLQEQDEFARGLWSKPSREDLATALQQVRQWKAVELDPKRFLYVAGCAEQTPSGWVDDSEWDELLSVRRPSVAFLASSRGDGSVLWETGIPPKLSPWYMHGVAHGDLCRTPEYFDALLELLLIGDTNKLFRTPPARRSVSGAQRVVIRRDLVDQHPSREDLLSTLLGRAAQRPRDRRVVMDKAQVSVVHGNLAYAVHPVLAGHYAGDIIVGAEDHLDRSMQGMLRQRAALGLYAGAQDTCTVVLQRNRLAGPAGAVIVGLGRPDALSPGSLREGVTRAALEFALAVLDDASDRFKPKVDGEPRTAGLSCLLVGSGAGGLSLRNVVCSILGGVGAANRRLADQQLASRVWIGDVQFMELWLDRATQAANALELALKDGELADMFVLKVNRKEDGFQGPLVLHEGQSGLRRVDTTESPDWWERMEISYMNELHALRFVAMTDRARAEVMQVAGQLRTADGFIEQAIANSSRDSEISRTLFEMLIPNRVKELAPEQQDVWLLLDERSAAYPWELLEDRWTRDGKPLAVAAGMLRQFKTIEFRDRPAAAIADNVLVIGDPQLPVRAGFPFRQLPGAQAEAQEVASLLDRHRFSVTRRIRTNSTQVFSALHGAGYRILHLAAHGVHEWELPESTERRESSGTLPGQRDKVSGMVIGDGVFLTPGDVEQMRIVPELVFINCCHLGQVGGDANASWRLGNKLAANLAAQFIRMGVRAVVAAGWAVDDAAALTFATAFYDRLLAGDNFGYAVKQAREVTYLQHASTNTWGAYQCYGDPEWRLRTRVGGAEAVRVTVFRSAAQAVTEIENISSRIAVGAADAPEALDETLRLLRKQHDDWLKRADVAAAAGIALGELERFDEAIEFLDAAIRAKRAQVSLRAVEQRANFIVKAAQRRVLAKPVVDPTEEIKRMHCAIADLEALCRLGETPERRSLLGSARKRLAWILEDDGERRNALLESVDEYWKAHLMVNEKRVNDAYSLTNWLIVKAVASWFGSELRPSIEAHEVARLVAEGIRQSESNLSECPSFWDAIGSADCYLAAALQETTLSTEHANRIRDGYIYARSRGASTKEIGSAREQLDFLVDMARKAGKPEFGARLAEIRMPLV